MKMTQLFAVAFLIGFAVPAHAQSPFAERVDVVQKVARDVGRVAAALAPHGHGREHGRDRGYGREHGHDRGHDRAPRGRWETVTERVLVPGYWREEHVPPVYGWRFDHCGHRYWGIVQEGGCRRIWVPPHWETRCRQVFVRC
ncbi:MAG: hypothetical protein JNN13_09680 [Planctomycetes bacterium]|nr:hypothetical protein [Planctomycetota bacterium]